MMLSWLLTLQCWCLAVILSAASRTGSAQREQDEQTLTNAELLNALEIIVDDVVQNSSEHSNNEENDNGGLVWKNLSVQTRKGGKTLVHPCTGFIPNGALCAILGPSGAGKSSLLAALGGRSKHILGGDVCYSMTRSALDSEEDDDFVVVSPDQSQIAWVSQTDHFFSQLSSRESLQLAAFLELPHWSKVERDELVQIQLESLGLLNVADNMIGSDDDSAIPTFAGANHRLSGGERRRLTVALELLTHELFLLADEPTSGLDTSLAVTVMKLIRLQAKQRQIPALCSLHQPRSSVWHDSIDYIILMAPGGHVCYCGSRKDCLPYFEQLGFSCPELTNPAEFLVDLVSIGDARDGNPEADKKRIELLARAFSVYQSKHWKDPSFADAIDERKQSGRMRREPSPLRRRPLSRLIVNVRLVMTRFGALFRRSWRQNIRGHALHVFRFIASASNAILLAKIFPTVEPGSPPSPRSVADRAALLSFGAINMAFMAFMKAVTIFSEERPVIHREQTRQQYSPLEYLAAKIFAELPLDAFFATLFTTILKHSSGLCISWGKATATFSLLTVASASLGFFISSWSPPSGALAVTASVPVLVVLMVVGIINPSGVDLSRPPPALVRLLKTVSPFRFAIEALCLGEYTDMEFHQESRRGLFRNILDLPKMGAMAMVQNGNQVIEALGLHQQTYSNAMQELAMLTIKFWGLSWLGLQVQQLWALRGPKREKHEQGLANEATDDVGDVVIDKVEEVAQSSGSPSALPVVKVPLVRRI